MLLVVDSGFFVQMLNLLDCTDICWVSSIKFFIQIFMLLFDRYPICLCIIDFVMLLKSTYLFICIIVN